MKKHSRDGCRMSPATLRLFAVLESSGQLSSGELAKAADLHAERIGATLAMQMDYGRLRYVHGIRDGQPRRLYELCEEGRAVLADYREAVAVR